MLTMTERLEGHQRDPHGRRGRPAAGRRRQGRCRVQRRVLRAPGRRPAASAPSRAVNADSYDADGQPIPQIYHGKTRRERHEELVALRIDGALAQAQRAHGTWPAARAASTSMSCGRWAARSASSRGVLEGAKGLVNGVTCGAGMPYRLAEIAARLRRPLLPDRLLRPRLQRAVEARLFQGARMAGRRGLRGPLAGRRPQRPVERRGPDRPGGPLSPRAEAARADARRRPGRHARSSWPAASGGWRNGSTGSTIPSSARSPSSSAPARC